MDSTTADQVQTLDVDRGNLIPKQYEGDLRTFTMVDEAMQECAEGAAFSDGRVVLVRNDGKIEERYDCVERLVLEWFGRGVPLWHSGKHHRRASAYRLVPRRFIFRRHQDHSSFSGEGVALEGVRWSHGGVKLMWLGPLDSFVEWSSIEQAVTTHGHDGSTVIEWLDPATTA